MKLTSSQNLLIAAVFSMLISAIAGGIQAGIEYLLRGGHITVSATISTAIVAFLALFGAALKSYVPGHVGELLTAKDDTIAQANTQVAELEKRLSQAQTPVQPPVVNVAPPIVNVPPASAPVVQVVPLAFAPSQADQPPRSVQSSSESVPQGPFPAPAQPSTVDMTPNVQSLNTPQQSVLQNAPPVSTYDFSQGQFVPQSVPGTASPDDTIRIAAVGK